MNVKERAELYVKTYNDTQLSPQTKDVMSTITDLLAEIERLETLSSQIATDWIPANQKLSQELAEYKAELRNAMTAGFEMVAEEVRQQTARECAGIAEREVWPADSHGVIIEMRQHYNEACKDIANAINQKFGLDNDK